MQAARWLSVVWGGILFASVASATVYELTNDSAVSRPGYGADSLIPKSLNAPSRLSAATLSEFSLSKRASASAMMQGIKQSGDTFLRTVDYAESLDLRATRAHSYDVRYFDNLRPYGLSNTDAVENDVAVTPATTPGVWAMLLIGAGLVGYQLRRKSKVRGVRITPS